ncbi:unnamed protein product [Spirodela intermedia]|uniref:Uncharacterized protein n=1 Tax=Spirodela intermedia TaxID=51605 RepID=A0ABN7EAW0_SPIIN|nr:unnamed protein product [Spirodela intermedia]
MKWVVEFLRGCHPAEQKTRTLRSSRGCHPTERSWMRGAQVRELHSQEEACKTKWKIKNEVEVMRNHLFRKKKREQWADNRCRRRQWSQAAAGLLRQQRHDERSP